MIVPDKIKSNVLNGVENSVDPGSTRKEDRLLEGKKNSLGLTILAFNVLIYSFKS